MESQNNSSESDYESENSTINHNHRSQNSDFSDSEIDSDNEIQKNHRKRHRFSWPKAKKHHQSSCPNTSSGAQSPNFWKNARLDTTDIATRLFQSMAELTKIQMKSKEKASKFMLSCLSEQQADLFELLLAKNWKDYEP